MLRRTFFLLSLFAGFISSCSTSLRNYTANKKYSKTVLQNDFLFLKKVLEKKHPSLYWYTSKDSIDTKFSQQYELIKDSMTEESFCWKIVSPFVSKIKCGHTSVSMSKSFEKWSKKKKFASFPLYLKIWNDSMAVTASLIKNDSLFKRGTIIKSINGINAKGFQEKLFSCKIGRAHV